MTFPIVYHNTGRDWRMPNHREGGDLVLLEQYRSNIRRRKTKGREQCRRKTMEGRVDGEQSSSILENHFNRDGKKGVVS